MNISCWMITKYELLSLAALSWALGNAALLTHCSQAHRFVAHSMVDTSTDTSETPSVKYCWASLDAWTCPFLLFLVAISSILELLLSSFLSEVSRAKRAIVGTLFKLGTDYITEELLNLNHFELYIFFPSLYAVYLFSVYLSLNTGIKPLCVIKYRHEKKIITYMVYLKIYIFTY